MADIRQLYMDKKQITILMNEISALQADIENAGLENMSETYVISRLDAFWYTLNNALDDKERT